MRASVVLLALLVAAAPACEKTLGAARSSGNVIPTSTEPRWQDAFEQGPELVVVVRPQALRRDKVYGPLLRRAIELAREQSPLVAATGALDAMVDAEEVIIGARDTGEKGTNDLIFVVRGVRAEIDPANLVDERGRGLWAPGPDGPAANVRELLPANNLGTLGPDSDGAVRDRDLADASLFELPGRTWVIATGKARARARDLFARGGGSSTELPRKVQSKTPDMLSDLDQNALAVARLSGPSLVSRVRVLRPPGLLAPLGSTLSTLTVVLPPGEEAAFRAILSYKDRQAVALAEATVRHAIEALSLAKSEDYGWLRTATVQASRCCVEVTTPLPKRLVDGLLHVVPALPSTDGMAPHASFPFDRRDPASYSVRSDPG
jgi:hypothetical protein